MQRQSYGLFSKETNTALIKKLALAITQGDEKTALQILSSNIDINEKYQDEKGNRCSILAISAIVPNKKIIEKLLSLGANPNELNDTTGSAAAAYSYPVKLLVWQVAAFSGKKEAVACFLENCTDLQLLTPDGLSILDVLQPHQSKDIQSIYAVTLKEMNAKQEVAYGANPNEIETSIIALIKAHQNKLNAHSTKDKKAAKKEIEKILTSGSDIIQKKLCDFDVMCRTLKDSRLLEIVASSFIISNNVRQLLGGHSVLHQEIADLIIATLEAKKTIKAQ